MVYVCVAVGVLPAKHARPCDTLRTSSSNESFCRKAMWTQQNKSTPTLCIPYRLSINSYMALVIPSLVWQTKNLCLIRWTTIHSILRSDYRAPLSLLHHCYLLTNKAQYINSLVSLCQSFRFLWSEFQHAHQIKRHVIGRGNDIDNRCCRPTTLFLSHPVGNENLWNVFEYNLQ